ncbi:hypothetical protein [Rhizomonospora bruguierae]|uniref:hypothetical protein n=1 Tax=Rhizomonospora bruguierae TaxID=1581705 RepID=UPI001BCFBB85|nr:hypothetical protein [Micromonospora sp. NBRC 107566]
MGTSNGPDRRDAARTERGADTMGGTAARQMISEDEAPAVTSGARAPGADPPQGEPGQSEPPDPGDQEAEDAPIGIGADSPRNEGSEDVAAPPVDPAEYRLGGGREIPEPEP